MSQNWARGGTQSHPGYGGQQAGRHGDAARDELFSGAVPAQQRATYGGYGTQPAVTKEDLQYMSAQQVLDHGLDQHRDTTATARRALQVVEQTKELQASTFTALQDQGHQMQRIASDMDRIGTDLTYSQRILRYMSTCCCLGFFCSCCLEPERDAGDAKWRSGAPPQPPRGAPPPQQPPPARGGPAGPRRPQQAAQRQEQQQQQQQPGGGGGAAYPRVNTDGLDAAGYGQQAAEINKETRQQDAYLDQISAGLEQLKSGALVMQEELGRQDQHVGRLHNDAHALNSRLNAVNREGFKRI